MKKMFGKLEQEHPCSINVAIGPTEYLSLGTQLLIFAQVAIVI